MTNPTYLIINTTRLPQTRTTRRVNAGPMNSVKNLFIGGSIRVVRGRPAERSENFIRNNIVQLTDFESKGLIEVTDVARRHVNLSRFVPPAPAPVVTPQEIPDLLPPSTEEDAQDIPPLMVEDPQPMSIVEEEPLMMEAEVTEEAIVEAAVNAPEELPGEPPSMEEEEPEEDILEQSVAEATTLVQIPKGGKHGGKHGRR